MILFCILMLFALFKMRFLKHSMRGAKERAKKVSAAAALSTGRCAAPTSYVANHNGLKYLELILCYKIKVKTLWEGRKI